MRYCDLTEQDTYIRLPKIDQGEVQLLWHCDYWDGPKSGLLLYNGKKHWFQVYQESDDSDFRDYYRRFLIIELSEAQLKEEEYWHALFQEKVGTHTDYVPQGKSHAEQLKPRELWHEFYEAYQKRQQLDLSQNHIVGWYET